MVGFLPAAVDGERGVAFGGSWECWGSQGEEGGVKCEREVQDFQTWNLEALGAQVGDGALRPPCATGHMS